MPMAANVNTGRTRIARYCGIDVPIRTSRRDYRKETGLERHGRPNHDCRVRSHPFAVREGPVEYVLRER